MAKCMIKGCKRDAVRRGLCGSCYQQAWKLVDSGKATWAELEAKKLCSPSSRISAFKLAAEAVLSK